MDSFIKIIAPMNSAIEPEWLENPQLTFQKCNIAQKVKFILGQAVSINYLERVFDGKLPVFVEAYKKYVLSFLFPDIENLKENDSNNEYSIEVSNAVENIRFLLTSDKKYFSAEECFTVLESNIVAPIPCNKSFYVPYLKFIDHLRKADDVQIDAANLEFKDFKVSDAVAIPQFAYTGAVLSESDETICESYTFDYKLAKKFADNNHCKINGILPYWLGFNYSQITFKGVLGIIGTYGALEKNPVQFKDSLSGAYYLAYITAVKVERPDDTVLDAIDSKAMTMLGSFLIDVCSRFKIAADAETLAMFYSADSSKFNFVTVLLADNPESVSKEAFAEFMNSAVSKVPLKAANNNENDSEDDGENPKEADDSEDSDKDSEKESDDDSAEIEDPPEFNEDDFKVEEDESDDESASSPDQNETEEATDETTDKSNDDQSEDQNDNDEDQSDTTEDQEKDEASDSDDKDETTDEESDDDSESEDEEDDEPAATMQIPVPNIPGINIQSGLDLNLADDGETIDSFLYRAEVGNFLEKVIESGNLSVQQESILKIIRSELLNILNISSLYNLVKETLSLDKQHSEK